MPRRILIRFRSLPELFRRQWFPKLAELCLKYATKEARANLSANGPLRILVDNTVLGVAVTHESKWITTQSGGYLARVPVHSPRNQSNAYIQCTYLTGLTYLAELGLIEFFLSAELKDEQFRQPIGRFRGYGIFDHSLFSNLTLKSIDGMVGPTMGPPWMNLPSAADQQRRRLRNSDDQLFNDLHKLLKEQLGQKCDQDAWHIRTAECHNLFCFLTTDGPLLKACKSLSKKEPLRSLSTRVMTPQELGAHLGIRPVAPILLSYNGNDALISLDQTMPEERRRKHGAYKR